MKKKNFVLVGATLLLVLLVSSSTGAGVVQSANSSQFVQGGNNRTNSNVVSGIPLTKKDILLLKGALVFIENTQYRQITQQIITLIEKQGSIRQKDVDSILAGTNVTVKINEFVQTGGFWNNASCAGGVICSANFPGKILKIMLWHALLKHDIFMARNTYYHHGIIEWFATHGYVTVGSEAFNGNHLQAWHGFSLGYTGPVLMDSLDLSYTDFFFALSGWALLTFISPL